MGLQIEMRLLDLGFFIDHVLADNRIKLLDLKLFWLGTLVLGGGVKVASAGAGLKLDFVTHDEFLKICFKQSSRERGRQRARHLCHFCRSDEDRRSLNEDEPNDFLFLPKTYDIAG
jgi:hypothetical protein